MEGEEEGCGVKIAGEKEWVKEKGKGEEEEKGDEESEGSIYRNFL